MIRADTDLAPLVWETHVREGHTASIEHLRQILPKLISASPTTRIVIDGLDECDSTEQKRIIDQLLALCRNEAIHCSFLVSSRNDSTISKRLRATTTISLRNEQSAIEGDIASFVKGRLNQAVEDWDLSITGSAQGHVEKELIRRSNGQLLEYRLIDTRY